MFPTEQFTCCQSTWWLFKQSITSLYFTQSFLPETLFSVVTINPSSHPAHSQFSKYFFFPPTIFLPQYLVHIFFPQFSSHIFPQQSFFFLPKYSSHHSPGCSFSCTTPPTCRCTFYIAFSYHLLPLCHSKASSCNALLSVFWL